MTSFYNKTLKPKFIQVKRFDPKTKIAIDGTKSSQILVFEISEIFKLKSLKWLTTLNITSGGGSTVTRLYKQGIYAFIQNVKVLLGGVEIFNMNDVDKYYASLVDLMKIDSLTGTGWNQWIGSNYNLATGGASGTYDFILPLKDIPVFDKDVVLDTTNFSNGLRIEITFKQFVNNLYSDAAPSAISLENNFLLCDSYDKGDNYKDTFNLYIKRIDTQSNGITSASSTINLTAAYTKVSKIWFSQLTTANIDDGTKSDQYDSKSSNITSYQFKIQNTYYPENQPTQLSVMRLYAQDLYEYKNSEKVFYYRGSDISDFTNNSFVGGFFFSKYNQDKKYKDFSGSNNSLILQYSAAPAVTLYIFTVYKAAVVIKNNRVVKVLT